MKASKTVNEPLFNLLRDGAIQYTGTENECYYKLQRSQGQSADHAIKYEGWNVLPAKQLRSTSKEVKTAIQDYIKEAIDFTSYEQESTLKNALDTYKKESGPLQGKSYQDHFIDFMRGLPSWFNVEFTYYDILQRMAKWGLPQSANKDASDSSTMFYRLIYREFCVMLRKEGLSIY